MINLSVTLDSSLLRHLRSGQWSALQVAWDELCAHHSMTELGGFAGFFHCDRPPTPDVQSLLEQTASFLQANVPQSVDQVARWLPSVDLEISQPLTVVFLPCGRYTFSPKLGLQLFSLDPAASPMETYLFLVHVYYHELSSLNETPHDRRCSIEVKSAADFKNWIKLLVRNEGIGNYAVLNELMSFREAHPGYTMRYFNYAKQIEDPDALKGAVSVLIQAFAGVNDENVDQFSAGINKIFRNDSLPVLNLVGIHMAKAIVNAYGVPALKDVYQVDARQFFELYARANAPFAGALGGL